MLDLDAKLQESYSICSYPTKWDQARQTEFEPEGIHHPVRKSIRFFAMEIC